MAHLHSVYDSDMHFSINPITREIRNESEKNSLVQYDHDSERFTFEIPRHVEGHDVTLVDKVEVHYINIDATAKQESKGLYLVDDVQISPEDNNVVIFSWLISGNATKYAGSLHFLIRFICLNGETIEYAWHTEIFKEITVSNGMNNGEAIIAEYPDVLEAWKKDVLGEVNKEFSTFTKISVYGGKGEEVTNITKAGTYIFDLHMKCGPCSGLTIEEVKISIGDDIGTLYYSDKIFYAHTYAMAGDCTPEVTAKLVIQRTSSTEYRIGFYIVDDPWEMCGDLVDGDGVVWMGRDYEYFWWFIYPCALQERADFDKLMKQYAGGASVDWSRGWGEFASGSDMMYNNSIGKGLYILEVTDAGEYDSIAEDYIYSAIGTAIVYVPENLRFEVRIGTIADISDLRVRQDGEGGLVFVVNGSETDGGEYGIGYLRYKKLF